MMQFPDDEDELPALGVSRFSAELQFDELRQQVSCEVPFPLSEDDDVDEFVAHLIGQHRIAEPLWQDLRRKFEKFVLVERARWEDRRGDEDTLAYFEKSAPEKAACLLRWLDKQGDHSDPETTRALQFIEDFSSAMVNSTPDKLSLLIEKEIEMAGEMRGLIRARDWELQTLKKECTSVAETSCDDVYPQWLSQLNEKLRSVHESYSCQVNKLVERHRRNYRKIITAMTESDDEFRRLLNERADPDIVISPLPAVPDSNEALKSPFDESYTIYLGAQLKTMHNARIVARRKPLSGPLGSNVEKRLQTSVNLYRRGALEAVVLLVEPEPMWHVEERTDLARACEQSTELHFDGLEQQLRDARADIGIMNEWRTQRAKKKRADASKQTEPPRQQSSCHLPGDMYITKHSNLEGAQVIFHLVADPALQCDEINSRHPCITALRGAIQICADFGVSGLSIPLLLVEDANECMTLAWCVKRVELVFKCVKGYLMEVCGSGWTSSAPGGPSPGHAPHFNVTFVIPDGLSSSVHAQIRAMFPATFHLVPTKDA